jgi:hypothetical protein
VAWFFNGGSLVSSPTTWTIGDVEFPFSPSQISDEVDADSEEFPLDGAPSVLFGLGKGVREVIISGTIYLAGLGKTVIESTYAGPLRLYQGTQQTIESPSGTYDGDWLVKKVSFKEQAEGSTLARIFYTITLWKPAVLVIL